VRGASPNDKTLKHAKDSLSINRQEERGNSKQMEVVGKNLEDYVSRQKFQVFFFHHLLLFQFFFLSSGFPFTKVTCLFVV
jgi:hypothetical protein